MGKHTGFTLVELLVVIAIIGLLSTIVIVSFGTVRNQAKDSTIKANMNQMRVAVEVHWGNGSTYVGANSRADFLAARNAANAAGGTAFVESYSNAAYCIKYTLPGGGNWCIDSGGNIGNSPAVCNTTDKRCNTN